MTMTEQQQQQQQQQHYWNCFMCAHQRNPLWRRTCAVCLSYRGQTSSPEVALPARPVLWKCIICDALSAPAATKPWRRFDGLDDDHWLADSCAACMSPRGSAAIVYSPPPPPPAAAAALIVPQTFECATCSDSDVLQSEERCAISADCSAAIRRPVAVVSDRRRKRDRLDVPIHAAADTP